MEPAPDSDAAGAVQGLAPDAGAAQDTHAAVAPGGFRARATTVDSALRRPAKPKSKSANGTREPTAAPAPARQVLTMPSSPWFQPPSPQLLRRRAYSETRRGHQARRESYAA